MSRSMSPAMPGRLWPEVCLATLIFGGLLGFSSYLLYQKSLQALEQEIKLGLMSNVVAAAKTLNGDQHRLIDQHTRLNSPLYQQLARRMEQIRQQTQDVRYIYTTVLRNNQVYFVVNPSPQNDDDGDGRPDPAPALMTPYQAAPAELRRALQQGSTEVSAAPYEDKWGRFISAYAPVRDQQGRLVAILAMDLQLASFFQRLQPVRVVFGKAVLIIVFLSLSVGLLVYVLRGRFYLQSNRLLQQQMALEQANLLLNTQQISQLQLRELPWCWRYGVPRQLARQIASTSAPSSGTTASLQSLSLWLRERQQQLLPTVDCQWCNTVPADCEIWLETSEWCVFWQQSLQLWQQLAGRILYIHWSADAVSITSWQVCIRLQPLGLPLHKLQPDSAAPVTDAELWQSFVAWQQQASAREVHYDLNNHGELVLYCTFSAVPPDDWAIPAPSPAPLVNGAP